MNLTSHAGDRILAVICKNLGRPPNIYPAIGCASSKRLAPPNQRDAVRDRANDV